MGVDLENDLNEAPRLGFTLSFFDLNFIPVHDNLGPQIR